MRENYTAWKINIEDFYNLKNEIARIRFIVNFAVLAPSSHNSQPWRFKLKDQSISIFIDKERSLLIGDSENKLLAISLGAVIKNIEIAANYYKYKTAINYSEKLNSSSPVATITFEKYDKPEHKDVKHLIFSIPKRKSVRSPYKNKMPSDQFIKKLESLSSANTRLCLIAESEIKNKIADIAIDSGIEMMRSGLFRNELSEFVKNNLTHSYIGMPAFGMNIPTIASFFVPKIIRYFNMNRLNQKKDEDLLKKHTPILAVITTRNNSLKELLNVGQLYEYTALYAEQFGIYTAIWAAPILVENSNKKLKEVLNTSFFPQLLFRIGYTDKIPPHSPRLRSNRVIF